VTVQDLTWALGRVYMGWPTRLATRPRAYGLDRVPRAGGLVYAINHMHWIDIPIMGALSPRNVHFVAKAEAALFPALGRFLRWHGTIAVRRGESDRDAVRMMRQAAREGGVVGLFVEGTRLKTGRPGPA
jgi:1-acyl-sn-glycerol-3-phosphate acyltransferase